MSETPRWLVDYHTGADATWTDHLRHIHREAREIDWRNVELRNCVPCAALPVILELAREALRTRDDWARRGWVMPEVPHEMAVRQTLSSEVP